jgi:hypothetical protein
MAFHLRENEANATHYRASKEDFGEARHNRKKRRKVKPSAAGTKFVSGDNWTLGLDFWPAGVGLVCIGTIQKKLSFFSYNYVIYFPSDSFLFFFFLCQI